MRKEVPKAPFAASLSCRLARWHFANFQKHAYQLEPRFNVLQKRLPSSLGDGRALSGSNGCSLWQAQPSRSSPGAPLFGCQGPWNPRCTHAWQSSSRIWPSRSKWRRAGPGSHFLGSYRREHCLRGLWRAHLVNTGRSITPRCCSSGPTTCFRPPTEGARG